jgi:hypothetical protein
MAFNAWSKPFEPNDYWLQETHIENYVLGINGIMSEQVANTADDTFVYLNENQHAVVANILLKESNSIYG